MPPARVRDLVVLGLVAICFAAWYLVRSQGAPLLANDTMGYVSFSVDRPVGYPLFLALLRAFTPDLDAIRQVQILIFCASGAILAVTAVRATGSLLPAVAFEIGALGHPGPGELANLAIADSLTTSVIMLFLAASWHFAWRPTASRFALACVIAVCGVLLRPVGVALLPALAIGGLVARPVDQSRLQAWLSRGAVLALHLIAAFAISPAVLRHVHGDGESTSILGRSLLQKAIFAPIDSRDQAPAKCAREYAALQGIAMSVNDYLDRAPAEIRETLRFSYAEVVRYLLVLDDLAAPARRLSLRQQNAILMCYAVARLRAHPGSFMQQTLAEYWKQVMNFTFISSGTRQRQLDYLESTPPVLPPSIDGHRHPTDLEMFAPPAARNQAAVFVFTATQVLTLALTVVAALAQLPAVAGRHIHPNWLLLGVAGIAVQTYLIVVVATAMASARYLFPIWPLLWLTLVMVAWQAYKCCGPSAHRTNGP